VRVEAEITVARPRTEVYAYLLRGERLPEYMSDFETVEQVTPGEPKTGTEYSYRMGRGAQGSFEWTKLVPNSHLAWSGPPVKAGAGSMQPAGWWDLSDSAGETRVQLVMAPQPGGLLKLLAPFMAAAMRRSNEEALARLKEWLERS
jgi:uncharacterized protein YndB with AHSA1/START domain